MAEEIVQYQRQAPFIEERAEQLLGSIYGIPNFQQQAGETEEEYQLRLKEIGAEQRPGETAEQYQLRLKGLAGIPQAVPAQQIAPLEQAQLTAIQEAQAGLGAYRPFLQQAEQTVGAGLGAIGAGVQTLDPRQVSTYMDPYQQQVTQQALAELQRQADIQSQRTAAEAVAAGAFGGSRFGVREAEEARNLAQVKSQRIFEDLSRNYLQAQQAQQQTAQQLGQLGVQTILEAARQTELARQQEPYRRAGFASDILRGIPSSSIAYTQQPSPSMFQQVAGLGIAGLSTLGALGGFGGGVSALG
jgi:hypothetical protein